MRFKELTNILSQAQNIVVFIDFDIVYKGTLQKLKNDSVLYYLEDYEIAFVLTDDYSYLNIYLLE